MNQPNKKPNWLLGVIERQPGLLIVLGAMPFVLLLMGVAYYLDERIEGIEDQLSFVPPSSYESPDLEAFRADVNTESLPLRQLLYVPVYSHIYYEGGSPYSLEATLSLRNVDADQVIYFSKVDYHDTEGKLVKSFLKEPIALKPLETVEFLVERRDSLGGSGANLIVEWQAESGVDKPLVEAVMVGSSGTNAICFSRAGIEISAASADTRTEDSQ